MRTRWDLMPRRVKRPGMLAGGDGSTLSLDFTTMSSLDSRFTFSRSSPATFINSQGRVQYATHNFLPNTVWTSTSIPTGWTAGIGTGQVTYHGDGSITMGVTGSTQRIFLTPSTAITVANGLKYRIGFLVQTVTGSPLLGDIVASNGGTDAYYINGAAAGSGDLVLGGDYVEIISTATGSTMQPKIGVGVNVAPSSFPMSIRVSNPMMNIGSETFGGPSNYVANTTTSQYQTPRFDYDPTTLAPRGLSIEGSATNELLRSNAFNTSPWFVSSFTTPSIASPAVTDPAGGTDTWYGVPSGAGLVYHGFRYTFTFTAATYTFSIWAKAAQHDKFIISDLTTGTGACRFDLTAKTATVITGTVTPTNPQIVQYPNGWFRCSFTMQMSAITTGMCWSSYPTGATTTQYGAQFIATGADGMYFYGAQLEIGSGATSYIPTGSSTVQRAADSCSMTGTNFSSWYPSGTTSGTFFCQFDNSRSNLGFAINPTPIALGEYSAGNLIAGLMNTTVVGSGATISVWGSGGSGLQQAAIGSTISQGNKIAFAFNGQTATGSLNGGSGTATTTGTVNAKTILFIGGSGSGSSLVRDYIGAPIQRIKFFPSVFSTAQLQSLTQ